MSEADYSDTYYYDNELFHQAIYTASHSFLIEQCSALHRWLRPYRRLQLRVRNRMKTSFSEHAAIVNAILSGDADAARAQLRQHIAVQGDRFSDLVATLSERKAPIG
jgi:DNA-binding GntR family transcriptional regulator